MADVRIAVSALFRVVGDISGTGLEAALVDEGVLRRKLGALDDISQQVAALLAKIREAQSGLAKLHPTLDDETGLPVEDNDSVEQEGPFAEGPRPALVKISRNVEVPAMVIDACTRAEVSDQIRGPMLCYVPMWGHFAVRLGRHIIHGNVGRILAPGTKLPVGVKECARPECYNVPGAAAECTYYHDPARMAVAALATDEPPLTVRSYMADSFVYTPKIGRSRSRYGGRPIGDIDSLGADIRSASKAEARRFLSQVAHDLVCAVALLHLCPDVNA